ncbi:hypothetical protein Vi05172_g10366 [Venturia inaequalis]|nr:hypothetical protein Vi05172_g10366 [Venturia inaequalis]
MPKPEPTNFFTLPLELRQQILAHTFPDLLAKDLALNRHLLHINYLFYYRAVPKGALPSPEISDSPLPTSAPHIHNWATTLVQAHDSIASDLPFLLKPLVEEIESTAQKSLIVGRFLYPANCYEYIDLFIERNIITESALANLNRDKIKEIGVESLSDQIRIAWHALGRRIVKRDALALKTGSR